MFFIEYNETKNRVYIKIKPRITEEEVEDYTEQMIDALNKAKKPFTVCVDLTEMEASAFQEGANFQGIRDYAARNGLRKVAIVLNEELLQFNEIHGLYHISYVFLDRVQAEAYLSK